MNNILARYNTIFNGARKGVQIPYKSDALFWLDGTISGTEFIDKSGNDRNFTITNKDFDSDWTKGFPYKSAATISAPVGDAELIAADFNNYLYDSGGTPNAIPVVSLFQDIDYEHKLFCRHAEPKYVEYSVETKINGVYQDVDIETYEGRVLDIVLYDTVKTGSELTQCQSYFSVPTEDLTAKWADYTNGDDTTGVGTKASPYKTITKAITQTGAGNKVYCKTSEYIEFRTFDHLWINVDVDIIGTGRVRLKSTSSSDYVLSYTDAATGSISRIWFVHTAENYIINGGSSGTIDKCYISGGNLATIRSAYAGDPLNIDNSIIISSGIQISPIVYNIKIDSCLLKCTHTDYNIVIDGGTLATINNNSIKTASTGIFIRNRVVSGQLDMFGNTFEFTANRNSLYISTAASASINWQYNTLITTYAFTGSVIQNPANTVLNNNHIELNNTTQNILFQECKNSTTVKTKNNIYKSLTTGNTNFLRVYNSVANSTTSVIVHNNKIETKNAGSYVIAIGQETTGIYDETISGIDIQNNYIVHNGIVNNTTHGIFIGHNINAIVRYNYVIDCEYHTVYKHSGNTITSGDVSYNLSKNSQILCFGATGYKVIGNTVLMDTLKNTGGIVISSNGGCDPINAIVKNNIIEAKNTAYTYILISIVSASGQDVNYNNFYSNGKTEVFYIGGAPKTKTEWLAAGFDANSKFTDPLLDSNLIPQTGSPAIENGVDVGATYKTGLDDSTDWGDSETVPIVVTKDQSGDWDIGAYIS